MAYKKFTPEVQELFLQVLEDTASPKQPNGKGIGRLARELLLDPAGFPHGVIAEMVNAQIEGAQASAKSVRWYAHDMRKKGATVPERQRVAECDPV